MWHSRRFQGWVVALIGITASLVLTAVRAECAELPEKADKKVLTIAGARTVAAAAEAEAMKGGATPRSRSWTTAATSSWSFGPRGLSPPRPTSRC